MCFGRRKNIKKSARLKPKATVQPQKQIEEIPEMVESEKKEEIPKNRYTYRKSEKVLDSQKEFLDVFKQFSSRHRSWDIWRDFITMFACSLSNPTDKEHYDEREALYLRTIKKYNKKEQELFPELAAHTVMALEKNPEQDFLGSIFMSLNLGNEHNGQFFTPYQCVS